MKSSAYQHPGFQLISDETDPGKKTRRKIARMASLVCHNLSPDLENPEVWQLKDPKKKIGDYHFFLVADQDQNKKEGTLLYGFANSDLTDFIPLEESRKWFEFLEFFHYPTSIDDQLINEFEPYLENKQAITECLPSFDRFLPCEGWYYVEKSGELFEAIQDLFDNDSIEQLWTCELSFSMLSLAECIFYQNNKRIKVYALYKSNKDNILPYFFILTGKSDIIHGIWNKFIDQPQYSFLIDSDEKYLSYLKFFCWAVRGEEGNFLLPDKIHEIPWLDVPIKEQRNQVKSLFKDQPNPKKNVETPKEGEKLKFSGLVVYGSDLYDAEFNIDTKGGVEMLDDQHLFAFTLKQADFESKKIAEVVPQTIITKPQKKIPSKEVESASFIKLLQKNGVVNNLTVSGKVTINNCQVPRTNSIESNEILVKSCFFKGNVILANGSFGLPITFEDCVFYDCFSAKDHFHEKSITFKNCYFYPFLDEVKVQKRETVLDLENYQSNGSLKLINCNIAGEVLARNAKIAGNFEIRGSVISHHIYTISSSLTNIEDIKIRSFTESNEILIEEPSNSKNSYIYINRDKLLLTNGLNDNPILNLDNASIKGDLIFSAEKEELWSVLIGKISGKGMTISGESYLGFTLIVGDCNFQNSIFGQTFRFSGDWIWNKIEFRQDLGSMILANCKFKGSLHMCWANLGENLVLDTTYVEAHIDLFALSVKGDINMCFSDVKGFINATLYPERLAYYTKNTYKELRENLFVGGDFLLSGSSIKNIKLQSMKINGKIECKTGSFESLEFTGGKSLSKTISNEKKETVDNGALRKNDMVTYTMASGEVRSIHLEGINVRGNIDFTNTNIRYEDNNLKKESNNTWSPNRDLLYIKSSVILGDLTFFEIEHFKGIHPDLIHNYKTNIQNGDIKLETLTVGGSICLKQIKCIKSHETINTGNIILQDSTIRRKVDVGDFLEVFYENGESQNIPNINTECFYLKIKRTDIEGNLCLSGLHKDTKLDMQNVTIRDWDFSKYNNHQTENNTSFLKKLLLYSWSIVTAMGMLSFTIWALFRPNLNAIDKTTILTAFFLIATLIIYFVVINVKKSTSDVDSFDEIMERMHPIIDLRTCISFEKKLRNEGRENEADSIHRKMRRKSNSQNKHANRKKRLVIYGFLTGYGTQLIRLGVIWYFLVCGLTIFLWYTNNNAVANINLHQAILSALDYCIPFFDFRDKNDIKVAYPLLGYAVSILSFILLSLAALGITSRMIHGKK